MIKIHRNFFLIIIVSFVWVNQSKAEESDQIIEIQKLNAAAQKSLKNKKTTVSYFKNPFDDDKGEAWLRWDGKPKEGESFGEWAKVYMNEKAYYFLISVETATPSGDWSCKEDYYFRRDESLAFIYAELRTFSGGGNGVLVAKRQYYANGKLIRKTEQIFDLKNPKKQLPQDTAYFNSGCPGIYEKTPSLAAFSFLF
jgi:hypothetical protein